jgi:hypothetical protein
MLRGHQLDKNTRSNSFASIYQSTYHLTFIVPIMHSPQLRSLLAVPVIAAVLLSSAGTQAMPTSVTSLNSRTDASLQARAAKTGFNGMGIPSLIAAIRDFLKDRNAYVCSRISSRSIPAPTYTNLTTLQDLDVPNKCILDMRTTNGGQCETTIQCIHDVQPQKLPDWNVCYIHGRQFFNHPAIGDCKLSFLRCHNIVTPHSTSPTNLTPSPSLHRIHQSRRHRRRQRRRPPPPRHPTR